MIISLNLIEDHLDELEKRFKMLKDQEVEVGMFNNDLHKAPYKKFSTFTNVALFTYLSDGDPQNNMAPRPVTEKAFMFNPLRKSGLTKGLKAYFKNISKSKSEKDVESIMHNLGKYYRNKTASYMGDSSILAKNTESTEEWKESHGYEGQAPLLMAGDLRSHVGYYYNNTAYEYGK